MQPENNSNLGSAIGSPFRSTSTQPVSSVYGGPAVNITGIDSSLQHTFNGL